MTVKAGLKNMVLKGVNLSIGYKLHGGKVLHLQKELNMELRAGELVCLVGPNGSGKSTLIRTLAGLQKPLSGSVILDGYDISAMKVPEKSQLLGIILTERNTVDNITVFEIVSMGRYNYTNWLGTIREQDRKKISKAIYLVGLHGFENRFFGSLSDGEKQRTFIAKTLASEASILLLDEPIAQLDIPNRVEIMTFLKKLTHISDYSVLVSTHELDIALKIADKIWLIIPGDKMLIGTPDEVIKSGYLDELFGNELISFK
ncbi:MAG: ABC transporter ATP-binding protein [Bacteroidales bacterium]|nr:ABC transporter ATP-binding protein [Bacteroidales bacterium]